MVGDEDRPSNWRSLRSRDEFERIYRDGTKLVGRYCVLYLLEGVDNARAVVASRKVGDAVRRNRAKRLLRAGLALSGLVGIMRAALAGSRRRSAVRDSSASPARPSGLWIVLVARPPILTVSSRDVAAEIAGLLGAGA